MLTTQTVADRIPFPNPHDDRIRTHQAQRPSLLLPLLLSNQAGPFQHRVRSHGRARNDLDRTLHSPDHLRLRNSNMGELGLSRRADTVSDLAVEQTHRPHDLGPAHRCIHHLPTYRTREYFSAPTALSGETYVFNKTSRFGSFICQSSKKLA